MNTLDHRWTSKSPNTLVFLIRFTVAVQIGAMLVGIGIVLCMSIVLIPAGMACFTAAGRIVANSIGKQINKQVQYEYRDLSDEDMIALAYGRITHAALYEQGKLT